MADRYDPHKSAARLEAWFKAHSKGIPGLNSENSRLIIEHAEDLMVGHLGSPVSKRGPRSSIRIVSVVSRLTSFSRMMQQYFGYEKTFYSLTRREAGKFFMDLRAGIVLNGYGKRPRDVDSIVKVVAAWFRWYCRREAEEGRPVPQDPFSDVSKSANSKPAWVYLDENQLKRLSEACNPKYRTFLLLQWDSGCRAPTEAVNVRRSDITEESGSFYLNIRPETSKTFGRRIRLMFSGKALVDFCENNQVGPEDYIFGTKRTKVTSAAAKKYYQRLAVQLFGDVQTMGRERIGKLTLYDFRHCAACYWIPRYKNQSSLLYRFGWKKPEMAHYYSEFLGMKDTIVGEDMVVGAAASALEKELAQERLARQKNEDELAAMRAQMEEFQKRLELIHLMGADVALRGQEENLLRPGTGK